MSPDLDEPDVLLSRIDMGKPIWSLLLPYFPLVRDTDDKCNRVETKKEEEENDKKNLKMRKM